MSEKIVGLLEPEDRRELWAKALKDLDAEIAADNDLTPEQKRFLLVEMNQLSDDEWEPITVIGEPVSETIIRGRGER